MGTEGRGGREDRLALVDAAEVADVAKVVLFVQVLYSGN